MINLIDSSKNLIDIEEFKQLKEITCIPGNSYIVDSIPVVCIKEGKAYSIDESSLLRISHSNSQPLFVDKNHDLSYYIGGYDYVDENLPENLTLKFQYEWGGYNKRTYIDFTTAGYGVINTNRALYSELLSEDNNSITIWEGIRRFRECYNYNWFIPNSSEISLIYNCVDSLSNISKSTLSIYWSSSEMTETKSLAFNFSNGKQVEQNKNYKLCRTRLCTLI